jgi:hypothetical protein
MGFESFRVELGGGTASAEEVSETLRRTPHCKPDADSFPLQGSTYYLIDDSRHVFELELRDSPVRLSCRFTLCHPPSVDTAFLSLVCELMVRLGMDVSICDDVRPEHTHPFSVAAFDEFAAAASGYIAARRTEWIAGFGSRQLAATTNEVHEQIILPRCQPVR